MKIFFRDIHLYLGLAAGLVIATICFTGATLVFEKEMQMFIYPERYTVQVGKNPVSIEQTIQTLQQKVPGASVVSVKIYDDPTRSYELNYSLPEKDEPKKRKVEDKKGGDKKLSNGADSKKAPEGRASTVLAFLNPYTGELISQYNHRSSFFFTMFSLHRWLLIGDTGKLITGISTSVFLFILITGIILWWPKNKNILKQRLKLKWSGGWKRFNHDFHIVLGFYMAIFLFTFAFTGLAWSFKWFNDGIYWITGTENKRPEPPGSTVSLEGIPVSYDEIYEAARLKMPKALHYTVNAPRDSASAYAVTLMTENAVHEKASDQLFFDQYSGNFYRSGLVR